MRRFGIYPTNTKDMFTLRSLSLALFLLCSVQAIAQNKVLVFSKTAGFRHGSIGVGKLAIIKLGKENGFAVDTTEDASVFHDDNLKQYNALVFLSTTGDILNHYQQAALERYMQSGGGYVGIHAATDCEYQWPWYGKLSGAYFKSHPKQQTAKLVVHDRTHISTAHLPEIWERYDEWYNFKQVPGKEVNVLISIDEKSYEGGQNGDNHPMAWYHDYDGGRSFYTELGHTNESYEEPHFLKHILGGIQYAMGNGAKPDYNKAKTPNVPEPDRFTKNVLAGGMFDEPIDMAILPNMDILITQRKGELMFYNHATKKVAQVAKLNVYSKTKNSANAEEGLIGIALDPEFAKNNFIYLFYATMDTAANVVSRFVFKDGKLDMASEKQILKIGTTREICCHTGGSLVFGPDNNLYISSGDNTTPFNQPNSKYTLEGYGPIDDRPGFEQYDGRRGSGNTNDLRGKILRIKVNPDASYSIPEGNLFKPGTEKTRPEIYAMGTRNPYRMSIDKKTGFVYWGDVGPDASNDKLEEKGSRGYDELNQARQAGNFGYPMFIGNNYPYRQFNYETGEAGDFFDPKKPMNYSKNNTGLVELPPVAPAFIWYPYAASPEFPEVGTGGRNAMAGPIYHPELYAKATRYPDYYKGKLLFYEWIRGWLKWVTMDSAGNYQKMEPFLEDIKFNSAMDIEVGPDGRFYVLEYGSGWFTKNADAALSRIDFNGGNRAPRAKIKVDKISGTLPLTIKADATGSSDPDKDNITYIWHFGKTVKAPSASPAASFTFSQPGEYSVYVEVKDAKGAVTKSDVVKVYAGNEFPKVEVRLDGGSKFYYPGTPVPYRVQVNDKEDGSTEKGGIDEKNIYVKVDYLDGPDKAQVLGHQVMSSIMEGKNLAATLDCKVCHKENEKSVGPSYNMVAAKYENDPKAKAYLTNKIIKGGGGVWGEVAMAAHPNLKQEEADKIVDWILSTNKKMAASLPAKGSVVPTEKDMGTGNIMQITATYSDKGGKGMKPLSTTASTSLRSALVDATHFDSTSNLEIKKWETHKMVALNLSSGNTGWIQFNEMNLEGIASIELGYVVPALLAKGYVVSIHQDNPRDNNTKIAELKLESIPQTLPTKVMLPLQQVQPGNRKLFLKITRLDSKETNRLGIMSMRFVQRK